MECELEAQWIDEGTSQFSDDDRYPITEGVKRSPADRKEEEGYKPGLKETSIERSWEVELGSEERGGMSADRLLIGFEEMASHIHLMLKESCWRIRVGIGLWLILVAWVGHVTMLGVESANEEVVLLLQINIFLKSEDRELLGVPSTSYSAIRLSIRV
ncbi:hypothetical protein GOBAR_DD13141 [Gossypium barbadense]|nr:hypothetical protein GOBAR_DD13141 [Gossypium barbadense]